MQPTNTNPFISNVTLLVKITIFVSKYFHSLDHNSIHPILTGKLIRSLTKTFKYINWRIGIIKYTSVLSLYLLYINVFKIKLQMYIRS